MFDDKIVTSAKNRTVKSVVLSKICNHSGNGLSSGKSGFPVNYEQSENLIAKLFTLSIK
jgi:hypothetical protein